MFLLGFEPRLSSLEPSHWTEYATLAPVIIFLRKFGKHLCDLLFKVICAIL